MARIHIDDIGEPISDASCGKRIMINTVRRLDAVAGRPSSSPGGPARWPLAFGLQRRAFSTPLLFSRPLGLLLALSAHGACSSSGGRALVSLLVGARLKLRVQPISLLLTITALLALGMQIRVLTLHEYTACCA